MTSDTRAIGAEPCASGKPRAQMQRAPHRAGKAEKSEGRPIPARGGPFKMARPGALEGVARGRSKRDAPGAARRLAGAKFKQPDRSSDRGASAQQRTQSRGDFLWPSTDQRLASAPSRLGAWEPMRAVIEAIACRHFALRLGEADSAEERAPLSCSGLSRASSPKLRGRGKRLSDSVRRAGPSGQARGRQREQFAIGLVDARRARAGALRHQAQNSGGRECLGGQSEDFAVRVGGVEP
jgi:hypothetical protein